jgi:hypothetical protein
VKILFLSEVIRVKKFLLPSLLGYLHTPQVLHEPTLQPGVNLPSIARSRSFIR